MGCSGLLVSGCMALSAFSLHHILLLGFFSLTALSVDVVGLLLRFTFLCRYVQLFLSLGGCLFLSACITRYHLIMFLM